MTSQKPSQGAVPKGDVSFLRAVPGPPFPVAPSPLPPEPNHHAPVAPPQHNINSDLQDKLEIQQRELEEIRARASQMEKTMRWWSDCTSNWREKWSKVRNERNKAREENRQLRSKLDACIKEINSLKREKEGLVNTNKDNDRSKVMDKQIDLSDHDSKTTSSTSLDSDKSKCELQTTAVQTEIVDTQSINSASEPDSNQSKDLSGSVKSDTCESQKHTENISGDRLALLELKLEESQKTITAERVEKSQLNKNLETTQQDINIWKLKYEELYQAKQDQDIQIRKLKEQSDDEQHRLRADLQDEQQSKSNVNQRLADLRVELERLQKENADEWGKRERMETEKLALERENKKLRTQITDLEEQLERKSTHASTVTNKDIKTLQMEVSERNKELADMKHLHTKVKKTLQERTTDLEHSKRRCDQFEMEVKKLRSRVDELKRELATAEDEVDTQANNVRKVQRSNDELQEQVENLQVQLDHLQSRLRRSSQPSSASHTSGHRSYSPDLHALEIDDDTDDDFSDGP